MILLLLACSQTAPPQAATPSTAPAPVEAAPQAAPEETGPQTIREAYPLPPGAVRLDPDSPADQAWADWLGNRSLADASEPVRTHTGTIVPQDARVVELDMVRGDLQQCADSIIRLRAEWQRETGAELMFHATSGDPIPWLRYQNGERARAEGRGLSWSGGHGAASWDQWLTAVFMWAGTASLQRRETASASALQVGDLLVQGGFPGHAVLLLDAARIEDETLLLIGEGFMPAQDFHVQHGPHAGWWRWEDGPVGYHWTFNATDLRRFR